MKSIGNRRIWYRGSLLVASILSIAAFMGLASIGTSGDEYARSQANQHLATSIPPLTSVERLDHSGIAPADPTEPDTTGISIAAYGI